MDQSAMASPYYRLICLDTPGHSTCNLYMMRKFQTKPTWGRGYWKSVRASAVCGPASLLLSVSRCCFIWVGSSFFPVPGHFSPSDSSLPWTVQSLDISVPVISVPWTVQSQTVQSLRQFTPLDSPVPGHFSPPDSSVPQTVQSLCSVLTQFTLWKHC